MHQVYCACSSSCLEGDENEEEKHEEHELNTGSLFQASNPNKKQSDRYTKEIDDDVTTIDLPQAIIASNK